MPEKTPLQNKIANIMTGAPGSSEKSVHFINVSETVSDEEISNATRNLYNNSPKFKEMMDKISDTGIPVIIIIGDDPHSLTIDKADTYYEAPTDADDQSMKQTMHLLRVEDEKGIVPNDQGDTASLALITLTTEGFSGDSYGLDKDGDGLVDDADYDNVPDSTIPFSYERSLTHELYHVLDLATNGASDPITAELDATKFEQEVMEEIHRPNMNQPAPEPRIYFDPTPAPAFSPMEPNILNTSRPSVTDVPWKWDDFSSPGLIPARPQPPVGVPRTWQPSPGSVSEASVEDTAYDSISEDGTEYYDGDPILANMGIEDSAYDNGSIEDTPYDSILDDGTEYYDGDPILANIENSSFYNEDPAMSSVENSAFASNWVEQQSSYDDTTPDEPLGPPVSTPDSFNV